MQKNTLKKYTKILYEKILKKYHTRQNKKYDKNYNLRELNEIYSRDEVYEYMYNYFNFKLSAELKEHRNYFQLNNRSYGEDPFHAMWKIIFEEYKPKKMLEIGVYRGQILTLWGILARNNNINPEIYGISPFNNSGDSVSKYIEIDYLTDVKINHKYFNLKDSEYIKNYSNDNYAISVINKIEWDLIYIDGSHDYEIVLQDYNNSIKILN
jgi:hypothetical protein